MDSKLHNILLEYIKKLESSRHTLPIVMKSLRDEFKTAHTTFEEFMDEHAVKKHDKENVLSRLKWSSEPDRLNLEDYQYQLDELTLNEEDYEYLIPIKKIKAFKENDQLLNHLSISIDTLPKNYLVSYVSQYDSFLGALVEELLLLKPELFNNSDRELKFKDLIEFKTIQEAREFILEKEINSLLRKSHTEQFEWMENKFDLPLTKGLDIWTDFIEITERRNLFVHNDGVVSNQYIKVCQDHKIDLKDIEVGTVLKVNSQYLKKSYSIFYEIGFKLVHVLWRKLFPSDLVNADISLIAVTFELLNHKRYDIAKDLLDFSTKTIKRYNSDAHRRMIIINRAIAYKFSNNEEKCESILEADDWSATGLNFQLAVAVLNDKDDDVFRLMKSVGQDDPDIPEYSYADWPLFEKYREKQSFQDTYKEIFGKELELHETI